MPAAKDENENLAKNEGFWAVVVWLRAVVVWLSW